MTSIDFSAYSTLPELQKKQLCIDLLSEFGAYDYQETNKGELQHQCTLPLGGHTDHNSMTASVNYHKLTFHCFVCGHSGGLLWWIAVNRRESGAQAQEWLKKATGLTDGLALPHLLDILESIFHPKRETRVLPSYDERILAQWTGWPVHHPYLTLPWSDGGREIPEDTLDRFGVGYCDHDDDWRYYQRIIIPMRWQGKLVGWQARKLAPDDPEPAKYKNSPDLPRDQILYGALDAEEPIVVESPMSVLRHVHHLPMVATLGASVSDGQLPFLHRYKRLTLFLDNDKAGWRALTGTKKNQGLLEKLRPFVDVRVVNNPWMKADPADLTDAEMAELVDNAVPGVLWRPPIQLAVYQRKDPHDGDTEVRDRSGAVQ